MIEVHENHVFLGQGGYNLKGPILQRNNFKIELSMVLLIWNGDEIFLMTCFCNIF